MPDLYSVLISGLTTGSIYVLVAVGFNIAFRPTNVFNFAYGDFVMMGALIAAGLNIRGTFQWFIPLVAVVVIVGALGFLVERAAVTPVMRRSGRDSGWIISTLAVSLVLESLASKVWGSNTYALPPPVFLTLNTSRWGTAYVSSYDVALVVLTLLIVAAVELAYQSRVGRALLAVAEDRGAAEMLGINPRRLSMWSFAASGAFAGLTAVIAAPLLLGSVSLGPNLLLSGFEAAAIGGVGSNKGGLVAGYLLGFAQAASSVFLAPGYAGAVTFAFLLLVLLIRPHGISGQGEVRYV